MFRFNKSLDVVTLFHRPASTSSVRALALLKQISATVGNNGSEGLAANHVTRSKLKRGEFELNVTDDAPTGDQLRSILEFVGARKASQLVKDARDEADAMKKLKENGDNFQRPVVVDWNHGRAVIGDNETDILKLFAEPSQ